MVGLKIFDYNMNLTLAKKRVTVELVALNLISLFFLGNKFNFII